MPAPDVTDPDDFLRLYAESEAALGGVVGPEGEGGGGG